MYDTRKDSDGGAWRKRTQHTSWYNETLNTSTRGSRREFPAVAVIVAETSSITIYDGDDPDLPMWMVFTNNAMLRGSSPKVSMLNGILVTATITWGAPFVDFIKDIGLHQRNAAAALEIVGGIVSRNTYVSINVTSQYPLIVNSNANDVAMTVLPNAPIDSTTGLPVPTIAVATNGGVSVIKDDGSVVDYYDGYPKSNNLIIDSNNKIMMYNGYPTNGLYAYATYIDIPSSDYSTTSKYTSSDPPPENVYNAYSNVNISGRNRSGSEQQFNSITSSPQNSIFFGFDHKLSILDNRNQSSSTDMVAYITSSYNTGWLQGDIKGAFLSDTDATNVTGSELVTSWVNGSTYAYDTLSTSGSTISSAISDGSNFAGAVTNAMSFTAGKKYVASFSLTINSGSVLSFVFFATDQSGGGSLGLGNYLTNIGSGNYSITFTAPSTGNYYLVMQSNNGSAENFTTGPVSVRLAEEDRSVNNKGLQVFGTITKSAVATGAELVAYSFATTSDYLEQPYNSDFSFGTGDFYFSVWVYPTVTTPSTQAFFCIGDYTTGQGLGLYMEGSPSTWAIFIGSGANCGGVNVVLDTWSNITVTRKSGIVTFYVNGVQSGTVFPSVRAINYNDVNSKLRISGTQQDTLPLASGNKISLLRISASAPSDEQIKKIYEDEKVLFQENAACTLHGSSDAVTALAYDDSTNLLYAGTSSGRSDFQGLRRINNTTTAVTTAISASNGLVAEQ